MMKNIDLFRLDKGLKDVHALRGGKFCYAVAKCRRIVAQEIEDLRETLKPTDDFKVYDEARLDLCREHARKDEDGKPVMEEKRNGSSEFVLKNRKKFDKAWESLKADHQETLDAREKQVKDWEALLDEEATIKLHLVSLDHLPDDITSGQLEAIFEMISENGVA